MENYIKSKNLVRTFSVKNDVVVKPDGTHQIVKERIGNLTNSISCMYSSLVSERGGNIEEDEKAKLNIITASNFLLRKNAKGENTRKCGLLLQGLPGTGKTTLMKAMFYTIDFLYDTYDKEKCVRFYTKVATLSELQKNDKTKLNKVKCCDVLFLDDIGFSGENEIVNEYGNKTIPFIDIMEYRYDRKLMTVATTNLTSQELKSRYGERIYSRFCEIFQVLPFTGKDYRKL